MEAQLERKIRYILEKGIQHTVQALSAILGCEVIVERMQLKYDAQWQAIDYIRKSDTNIIMLKTELMGVLKGINYLLFTQEEIKTIQRNCFPEEMTSTDSKEANYMLVEFLKELENIAAASTISEMAEILQMELYGDVPKIQGVTSHKMSEVISKETEKLYPKIQFQCKLHVKELGISPEYDWLLNEAFLKRAMNIDIPEMAERKYA